MLGGAEKRCFTPQPIVLGLSFCPEFPRHLVIRTLLPRQVAKDHNAFSESPRRFCRGSESASSGLAAPVNARDSLRDRLRPRHFCRVPFRRRLDKD